MTRLERMLIVGSGSIAARHVRLTRELFPWVSLARLRRDFRPPAEPSLTGVFDEEFDSWDEALNWNPDAAIVANAASAHYDALTHLVKARVPSLVEKPLAISTEGLDQLAREVAAGEVPVLVGYQLRYHPLVQETYELCRSGSLGELITLRFHVGQHLKEFRPGRNVETTVTPNPALGGGAIFELSHEIDLALFFAGRATDVSAQTTRSGHATREVEDVANIAVRHAAGPLSMIHLNLLERPARRGFTVVGSTATVHVDLIGGSATFESDDERRDWSLPSGFERDDLFRSQLTHLVTCVCEMEIPKVSIEAATEVVRVCCAAHQSSGSREGMQM